MTYFKTGDIIAFEGVSAFSRIIQLKTNCNISHVGIVIMEDDVPILCESTTLSDLADHETGKVVKGVQKHILADRVNTYDGKVFHCPLMVEIPNEKAMRDWLSTVHSKETKYDLGQAIFSGLFLKHFFESRPNFNKLFCSELCYKAFQEGGVISSRFNASEQNPHNIVELPFLEEMTRIDS